MGSTISASLAYIEIALPKASLAGFACRRMGQESVLDGLLTPDWSIYVRQPSRPDITLPTPIRSVCPDKGMTQAALRSWWPSSFDRICQVAHDYAPRQRPQFGKAGRLQASRTGGDARSAHVPDAM